MEKEFVKEECCKCGIVFGVSPFYSNNLRKTKQTFYCPNGHGQNYVKSTTDILQEKLDTERRLLLEEQRKNNRLENELRRAQKTKKKK